MHNSYCPYCMTPVAPGEPCSGCGRDPSGYRAEPHHIPVGTILQDRYYVGKSLGEGGFGITYLGRDCKLDRRVAIKEYFPRTMVRRDSHTTLSVTCYAGSGTNFKKGVDQFLTEAKTLAHLEEIPEIVKVIDCFPENNTAYIIMEYLDGINLAQYGIRTANEIFQLLKPVMVAMASMHQYGVIHRDISPDNLMLLTKSGKVKLMDFGCAREVDGVKTMTVTLKPGFAPLEQYTGYEQGPWTDIYAFCATIYYCITGKLPPDSNHRAGRDELIPPSRLGVDISYQQEQALMTGLAVKTEDRWKNMAELYRALYGTDMPAYAGKVPDVIQETAFVPSDRRTGAQQSGSRSGQYAETEFVPDSQRKTHKETHTGTKDRKESWPPRPPVEDTPEKKKKRGGVVALLLILLLGGAAAFWFFHPHQYGEWTVVKEPTCVATGLQEQKCFCGEVHQETIDMVAHTTVKDEAVEATCVSFGMTEGSHCAVCGEVFVEPQQTPMTSHDTIVLYSVAATCTEEGLTEGLGCAFCDHVDIPQETIPALGHDPVTTPAVEATCKEEGKTQGVHCARCNKAIVEQKATPKTEHTPVTDPAVAATCKATGKTEGSHCEVCGFVIEAQNTVAKTDHTPVSVPAVAATCYSNGKTEGTRCSVCNVTLKGQESTPKADHTPVTDYAVAATCSSTGKTEGSHCSVCSAVLKAQESVAKIPHTPVTDPSVAATCTEPGLSEGSHCSVCGETLKEQTPTGSAKGHDIRQSGYCNNCGQPQWSMSLSISPDFGSVGDDGSILVTISYQLHGLDPNYSGSFTYRQTQTGQSTQSSSIGCTKNGDSGSFTIRIYNWQGTTLSFSVYSDFGWEIASRSYSF